MNLFKNSLILLIIAIVFGSCQHLNPPSSKKEGLKKEDRVRQFNQDKYRTFNAIMEALKKQGYSLETTDSNEGFVFTDYQLASTVGAPISSNAQLRVEAVLTENGTGTQVMLTLRVQQEVAMTGGQPSGVTQAEARQYYDDLFSVITTQVSQ
jgi:hypothetical protein